MRRVHERCRAAALSRISVVAVLAVGMAGCSQVSRSASDASHWMRNGQGCRQDVPPGTDKLDGKPLAAGEKIVLGAGGTLMGGDQITCGVRGEQVACELIRGFAQNHGGPMAQRHGFVLGPRSSWTY